MFRNFLTHQLAQGFDRACVSATLESLEQREELMRCSRAMLHHFHLAIHAQEPADRQKWFYVALIYLRDCKEILDRAKYDSFEVIGRFEVLHGRLEQLIWEGALGEKGQLRMLG